MTTTDPDVYYDPYDFEIDADPYPVWKRLRDERPLYYNERYDFYALSRFDDVERGLGRLEDVQLGQGHRPRADQERHGDPARLDHLRGPAEPRPAPRPAVARLHAPQDERHRAEGPRVLRPHASTRSSASGGFDFIRDLGAQMPMRTIGMLLGIPEQDQEAIRDRIDEGLRLEEGAHARHVGRLRPASTQASGVRATTSTGGPSTPPTT